MKLESIYIECTNFIKSIEFYKKLLEIEPEVFTKDRYVIFDCGNKIALYNKEYDLKLIAEADKSEIKGDFNEEFLKQFKSKNQDPKKNNIITLNLYTNNLKQSYNKIKAENLGIVSEIMYLNITAPYYYFTIIDPDGNELEIYGNEY